MVLFSLTVSERLFYVVGGAAVALYMGVRLQRSWTSKIVRGQGRDYDRATRPVMYWYFLLAFCFFIVCGVGFIVLGLFGA